MKPITSRVRVVTFVVLMLSTLGAMTLAYITGITNSIAPAAMVSPDPFLALTALGITLMLVLHAVPFGRLDVPPRRKITEYRLSEG